MAEPRPSRRRVPRRRKTWHKARDAAPPRSLIQNSPSGRATARGSPSQFQARDSSDHACLYLSPKHGNRSVGRRSLRVILNKSATHSLLPVKKRCPRAAPAKAHPRPDSSQMQFAAASCANSYSCSPAPARAPLSLRPRSARVCVHASMPSCIFMCVYRR